METNSKKEESLLIPPLQDDPHYSPQPPARVYIPWVSTRPLAVLPYSVHCKPFCMHGIAEGLILSDEGCCVGIPCLLLHPWRNNLIKD